jgi:hypothetical protein
MSNLWCDVCKLDIQVRWFWIIHDVGVLFPFSSTVCNIIRRLNSEKERRIYHSYMPYFYYKFSAFYGNGTSTVSMTTMLKLFKL